MDVPLTREVPALLGVQLIVERQTLSDVCKLVNVALSTRLFVCTTPRDNQKSRPIAHVYTACIYNGQLGGFIQCYSCYTVNWTAKDCQKLSMTPQRALTNSLRPMSPSLLTSAAW